MAALIVLEKCVPSWGRRFVTPISGSTIDDSRKANVVTFDKDLAKQEKVVDLTSDEVVKLLGKPYQGTEPWYAEICYTSPVRNS